MALYDGFFDATMDSNDVADRAYNSADFTGYFDEFIGSGVSIYNNESSYLVRQSGSGTVVSSGFLFIRGYWLRNTSDYSIPITSAGVYAIIAQLNTGSRMIELKSVAKRSDDLYGDALVLAYVTKSSTGTISIEDTRYNTEICGVIEPLGNFAERINEIQGYIDSEIGSKITAMEEQIAIQSAELELEIGKVKNEVQKIKSLPIGSIRFTADPNPSSIWLKCDGSYIYDSDYPELVSAIGKLIPSGDKFHLISSGEIGQKLSNGVLFNGRIWVYSYDDVCLYGVDVNGVQPVKAIPIKKENAEEGYEQDFGFVAPTNKIVIALSIVDAESDGYRLYIIQNGYSQWVSLNGFTGNEDNLILKYLTVYTYSDIYYTSSKRYCIPYVIKSPSGYRFLFGSIQYKESGSTQKYQFAYYSSPNFNFSYSQDTKIGFLSFTNYTNFAQDVNNTYHQVASFSKKNRGELVAIITNVNTYQYYDTQIKSSPNGYFESVQGLSKNITSQTDEIAMNVAGYDRLVYAYSKTTINYIKFNETSSVQVQHGINLPSAARIFPDAAVYLWDKDVYLFFVGTGIIFSRTLESGSFGYLDTTDVLGTITNYGFMDYDEDESFIYIVGQDSTNTVKVARMNIDTMFNYGSDGAFLPIISQSGVPGYIKAREE